MTDREVSLKKSFDCSGFRNRIFDFQADELPEDDREAFCGHVEACPPCARRLEVEEGFLRSLKSRMRREPAPPGLEGRLREALRREAPAPAGRGWWARTGPWAVPLAASILLALLLVPVLGENPDPAAAGMVAVDEQVTVVDFDCDTIGRSIEQQIDCGDPNHLNALKISDGGYWNLGLDGKPARRLVVDEAMRGHLLRVRGYLDSRFQTLWLTDYTDLGPNRAARPWSEPPFVAANLLLPHL